MRSSSAEREASHRDTARNESATACTGMNGREVCREASATGVMAYIADAQSDAIVAASEDARVRAGELAAKESHREAAIAVPDHPLPGGRRRGAQGGAAIEELAKGRDPKAPVSRKHDRHSQVSGNRPHRQSRGADALVQPTPQVEAGVRAVGG